MSEDAKLDIQRIQLAETRIMLSRSDA